VYVSSYHDGLDTHVRHQLSEIQKQYVFFHSINIKLLVELKLLCKKRIEIPDPRGSHPLGDFTLCNHNSINRDSHMFDGIDN
jgi:hypothetical protein